MCWPTTASRCRATPRHHAAKLRAGGAPPHNLASLAERHLGPRGISYEDLCGKGAHQIPFAQVPVDKAGRIRAKTPTRRWRCTWRCGRSLEADAGLRFIYELEIASSEVLYRIERNGVLIDARCWPPEPRAGQRILAAGAARRTSWPASPSTSAAQADRRDLLRQAGPAGGQEDRHRRAQHRRGGAGKLAEDYPLPARILEHRGLAKLKAPTPTSWPQMATRPPAACTPTTRRPWR